jgi:hypothetical protein
LSAIDGELSGQQIVAKRTLRVGVASGDSNLQFHRIADVDLIGDSLLAVASAGTLDVRLFDLRGRYIRSWGRAGEGPGEFRWIFTPGGLHVARDSVWVFDVRLQRVNVYSIRGEFGRTIPLVSFQAGRVIVVGVFPDGSLLLHGDQTLFKRIRGWQDAQVEVFKTQGSSAVSLGMSYWLTQYMAQQPAVNVQAWGALDPPGSIQAAFAVAEDGFWYTDGRQSRIEKRGVDGRLLRTVPVALPEWSFTPAALHAAQRHWLAKQDPGWQPRIKDVIENGLEPPPMPPRGAFQLIVDDEGAVWYTGHDIGISATRVWYRSTADGRTRSVRLPANFVLRSVRRGIAAGMEKDELDVEYVTLYDVR